MKNTSGSSYKYQPAQTLAEHPLFCTLIQEWWSLFYASFFFAFFPVCVCVCTHSGSVSQMSAL